MMSSDDKMEIFTAKKATEYKTRAFPNSHSRKSPHRGGIILQEGVCLQRLQQYYPFVVSLGYQLYRTMMLLTPASAWWGNKGSKDLDKYLTYRAGNARVDLDLLALGARDFRGVLGNTVRDWASDHSLGLKATTADVYHILFNLIKGHHYDGLRLMLTEIREIGGDRYLDKLWMMRKGCRKLEANLLQAAVQTGSPAFVKVILDFGAAEELVNYSFDDCELPLLLAMYESQEGDVQIAAIVELLLKFGAEADRDPEDTGTALYEAAGKGFKHVVKVLVEKGKADITKGYEQELPIFNAASAGKLEVVKYLTEAGSPLESDDGKYTLLHSAAEGDNAELVAYALETCLGKLHPSTGHPFTIEDPALKEEHRPTPLYLACERGKLDCVKVIVEQGGADVTTRVGNVLSNPAEEAKSKLKKKDKGETHENDQMGETCLHAAANSCSDETLPILRYLIEKGANPKIENAYGYNCLDKLLTDDAEIVELLVGQYGLDPARTVEGVPQYALYYALSSEHTAVAKSMLTFCMQKQEDDIQGGAGSLDLNLAAYGKNDGLKLTLVSVAVDDYSAESLKLLKEVGADFNAKNSNGSTPIGFLFTHDPYRSEFHVELEALLNGGADGKMPTVKAIHNPKKKTSKREKETEHTALDLIKELWNRASTRNSAVVMKRLKKERERKKKNNLLLARSSSSDSESDDDDSSTDSSDYISQMDENELRELMNSLVKCKDLLQKLGGVEIPHRYPVTFEITDEDLEELSKDLDDDLKSLGLDDIDTDDLGLDDDDSPPPTDDDSD